MNPHRLRFSFWAFPLVLTTMACPTRTVPTDGGEPDAHSDAIPTGGHKDSGTDRGGAGGAGGLHAAGGTSGAAGTSAAAGTGGAAGSGGSAGTGGGATVSGGAAATGGAAASGGATGTGGAAGSGGTIKDGQPCSLAKDCVSGTCTPFYVDVDSDGYGAGQAIGFCGTTPPIGYSAQSGDCCDSAPNLAIAKLIHPGADFQTTVPAAPATSPGTTTAAGLLKLELVAHAVAFPIAKQ